jgi:hypothetical protein
LREFTFGHARQLESVLGSHLATLPGASWQRCRTHYATNLMAITPKSSWPWVRTLLHSVFDQPDAQSVAAQYDRIIDALSDKLPKVAWVEFFEFIIGSGIGPVIAVKACIRSRPTSVPGP